MPFLTFSLSLGTLSGLAWFDGTLGAALGWAALALGAGCWLGLRAPRSAVWLGALFVSGLLHALAVGERQGPRPAGTESASGLEPGALWEGCWQNIGKGPRGFVIPDSGQEPGRWVLAPEAGRVADGARVSLRTGEGRLPWPAGPRPGPSARSGRFLGSVPVQPDELIVHASPSLPATGGPIEALRRRIQRRVVELEPEGLAHGLLRALLLGDRSRVSSACLDLFTRTGARHGLALSGLHVGLLAGLLLLPLSALLRLLPRGLCGGRRGRETLILLIRLSFLAGFLWLVGAGPPVLRAVCALGVALLAPKLPSPWPGGYQLGRRTDSLSIWSLALLFELVANPVAIQQLSLRLSYVATLGILLGTTPLMRLLGFQRELFDLRFRSAGPRLFFMIGIGRLWRALGTTLCASLAAVAATLPDIASHFGEFSPSGVLFAPLVLALLALLLISAWIAMLVPLDLWATEWAESLVGLLQWIDRLPGTPMPLPARPALVLWLVVALWFLCLRLGPAAPRLRRITCVFTGILFLPWNLAAGQLELHLLDVGHGTCAVLRAPGLPALIFDAGSLRRPGLYKEALAPLLAHWEVERPWVVLSHHDRDHLSALPRLVERYPPGRWMGALPKQLGERLAHALEPMDLESGLQSLHFGSRGSPLELQLMRGGPLEGNEGSRSLLIRWRNERILLAGDAEGAGLAHMLSKKWLKGPLRLLLFPHHGSQTPQLSALLAQAQPAEIWISAASERPAVVPELDRRGIPWSCTAQKGPLALCLP